MGLFAVESTPRVIRAGWSPAGTGATGGAAGMLKTAKSQGGRVRALHGLAGDKLLALFGRAAPRDFVDAHALRRRFTRRELEAFAVTKDRGFSRAVLLDAFDADFSQRWLDRHALGQLKSERIAKFDSVKSLNDLRNIGKKVATSVSLDHFAGFLN